MLVVESTDLAEIVSLVPNRFGDERGYFSEVYNERVFADLAGYSVNFVQDNESLSVLAGTVRGLHFQLEPHAQGKLVRVTSGALVDVCVDIRVSSPTFGQYMMIELDSEIGKQLWIPPGFAHGFCSLVPNTIISYKVTNFYNAEADRSLAWNDPDLQIIWPIEADDSTLSSKDKTALTLSELKEKGELFD